MSSTVGSFHFGKDTRLERAMNWSQEERGQVTRISGTPAAADMLMLPSLFANVIALDVKGQFNTYHDKYSEETCYRLLCMKYPNLTHLTLGGDMLELSCLAVVIYNKCPKLESLSFSNFCYTRHVEFYRKEIISLTLTQNISDGVWLHNGDLRAVAETCSSLQTFCLSIVNCCPRSAYEKNNAPDRCLDERVLFDDKGLEKLAIGCPQLKNISLDGLRKITMIGVKALFKFCQPENVSFTNCPQIPPNWKEQII